MGVRELRQNLSVYLVRVKRGETMTVTEHGRAVAELRPLPGEDRVQQLVAEGWVAAARRSAADLPRPMRPRLARPVSALLQALRDESP